jgi:hypothetical protein
VYNYPKEIKAFYMKLNPDGKTVAAMDVLVPKVCFMWGGRWSVFGEGCGEVVGAEESGGGEGMRKGRPDPILTQTSFFPSSHLPISRLES